MAIIVETGAGLSTAESYISVAEVDSYHSLRGNTTWATITTAEKEQALRRSSDYLIQAYYGLWLGYRKVDTQALDFPRTSVPITDGYSYYPDSTIPQLLKNAQAELAWKAAQGDLNPDLTQRVIREKIDVLEVEYDSTSPQYVRYRSIDSLLSSLLQSNTSSAFRQVVRA